MSFILDALRKSEHARQHLGGATLAELPLGRRHRGQPWWVVALAALLIINLIVLTIVLLRKPAEIAVVPADESNRTSAQNQRPLEAQKVQPTPGTAQPTIIAPSNNASPNLTTSSSLAEEAQPLPNVTYERIPREEAPLDVNAPAGPALVRSIDKSEIPRAPIAKADGLPELHVDMHVYAKEPKDRLVYINMHKYIEGQVMPEGPRIEEITEDGVILLHEGQRLRLSKQ